eukprot:365930-Chlamydomonas_euryale.AAC.25
MHLPIALSTSQVVVVLDPAVHVRLLPRRLSCLGVVPKRLAAFVVVLLHPRKLLRQIPLRFARLYVVKVVHLPLGGFGVLDLAPRGRVDGVLPAVLARYLIVPATVDICLRLVDHVLAGTP